MFSLPGTHVFFSNAAIELSEQDHYLRTEKLEQYFPQKT